MDPMIFILLALFGGLLLGGLGGWIAGARPVADLRARLTTSETEAKDVEAKFLRAFADLEAARETGSRVEGLEQRLDPGQFVRVHRSALVRAERIVRVARADGGHAVLTLETGAEVPVSRRYAPRLKQLARRPA